MQNHSRSVSGANHRKAVVELSNHEIADETAKQTTVAKRRDERLPKLSPQITKKQQLHKKNKRSRRQRRKKKRFERTAKNSKNLTVKEWSKG